MEDARFGINLSPPAPPFGVFDPPDAPLFGVGVFLPIKMEKKFNVFPPTFHFVPNSQLHAITIPGDFPLKLTELFFCGVLFDDIAVVDVLSAELYEMDIFDVFALALRFADDPFNFFCHRGIGPLLMSPSIMNALLISFI